MVSVSPAKKPKTQICKYGFCDGAHIKIENRIGKTSPSSYFLLAIGNSVKQRYAQEKLKKKEAVLPKMQNKNICKSISNLETVHEIEIDQNESSENKYQFSKTSQIQQEESNENYYEYSSKPSKIQYSIVTNFSILRTLLVLFKSL